ncbi:hypothetical protein U6N30_05010 [Blastococcus brunescens]|uniref:DUF7134 domain-containing protein n=1 Tax=Blastococcus brunescens TaxID=1564165 RepID=A0ABZ1B4H5_9ACTN|nr:hypothetical protein [Blastococcus sp. BMG 8361]WRL65061.1 hypothetical protein U6N30_05010 [Blastococcus sp. BMG 8361]
MSGIAARWHGLSLWVRDGLLALALTAVGQVELVLLADEVVGSRPLQHAAFAITTGALVARRTTPLIAAVAGAVGLTFQTLIGDAPAAAAFAAVLILTYSVAQYVDRRRDAVLGLLAVLAAIESYAFVADEVKIGDEIANLAIPTVVWVFARLARERLDRAVTAERGRWPLGRRRARRSGRGPAPSRPSGAGSPARCTTSSATGSRSCCCTPTPSRRGWPLATRRQPPTWTSSCRRAARRSTTCTGCCECCARRRPRRRTRPRIPARWPAWRPWWSLRDRGSS